jgi:hypothetical protein
MWLLICVRHQVGSLLGAAFRQDSGKPARKLSFRLRPATAHPSYNPSRA